MGMLLDASCSAVDFGIGGGGGRGGKRVMVGKINWSQGTYPCPPEAPPLGISPSTTLEQLLPLLSDVAAERTLFSQKPWRRDLAEWDERTKPAAIAEHRRLQAVVVRALSDEIVVLRDGVVVEQGKAAEVFERPKTDYTNVNGAPLAGSELKKARKINRRVEIILTTPPKSLEESSLLFGGNN